MSDELDEQARACAARVPNNVGFDPITIVTILTQVLPLLMSCFQRNDEPSPAAMRAEVKAQQVRAPEQLRRRTARRIRGDADVPMTKTESLMLADAVIAECCESEDSTVVSLAMACGITEPEASAAD
ncbi:hypothetical protein UFOVP466_86 [uncultured Caudovirales phage]|uniref:Uncharacterized protein n=1 Tax=uncultured Caudovirales phage TaxID=2100421 RepID=A0A6J5ME81_9CAUD|nr:hypothetical protein UFOVP466_86 [uncultured Caudovirales phage]CAB4180468.1 hypothetical protein UFOVP1045_33 [uncultured Caudovirales phage]CAB4190670.1 hypothetical protein UFOVP1194_87 [uncultured Caudovirales phage]CAB4221846.1 hypothetical protein UFOVP1641_83 [uncultured Caudovirales phage]